MAFGCEITAPRIEETATQILIAWGGIAKPLVTDRGILSSPFALGTCHRQMDSSLTRNRTYIFLSLLALDLHILNP
jgi:hypothetical protein